VNLINNELHDITADWVYILDADEFIFPPNESPYNFLSRQNCDVIRAAMFQVYRYKNDKDLDPLLSPIPQRMHGDPDIFSTETRPNRDFNAHYIKPIVIRPLREIEFEVGNHAINGYFTISPEFYIGAHWSMADPPIAINRRIRNRNRMSMRDKTLGMGWQNHNVTEDWIIEECAHHLNDPIIEELKPIEKKSPEEIKRLCNNSFIQKAFIIDLQHQLNDRENQLNKINNSMTWRIAKKLHTLIDTIFLQIQLYGF
jgi:hypothetical protein